MRVAEEDIARNLENIREEKALDMPLAVLDGRLKQAFRRHSAEYREYQRKYKWDKNKAYLEALRLRKRLEKMAAATGSKVILVGTPEGWNYFYDNYLGDKDNVEEIC
jgi:hypothetical protein